jgi:hypothetical protein
MNRYIEVSESGHVEILPYIKIDVRSTDKYEQYLLGTTRFDLLSNKYYKDPNYDWLILLANPDLPSLEFEIEDGSIVRIPYPLEAALDSFFNNLENYKYLYGF